MQIGGHALHAHYIRRHSMSISATAVLDQRMANNLWNLFHLQLPAIKRSPKWLRAWVTIGAFVSVCALIACVIMISILLVRLGIDALLSPAPIYQEAARNFLLAFASAFGAPFLVWRAWVAHQQAKAAAEQARVALENHITGIFSKSVEMMGFVQQSQLPRPDGTFVSRSVPNIEARLGAIYSLERILRESEKDQRAILETLCAYVRENTPLEIPDDEAEASIFYRGEMPPSPTRRKDVQAAITVIGRRPKIAHEHLDFRSTNLVAYDFSEHNFDHADFSGSFLNAANMVGACFANCIFSHTFLRAAKMKNASFQSSVFDDCDFTNAEIERTDFKSTKITRTDLRRAHVTSLHFEGANLEAAFGYSLEYAVKAVKSEGPNHFNADEIFKVHSLFQKATYDERTTVSQAVRDALDMMTRSATEAAKPKD